MTERRLRYSERKRLAETGQLGDLSESPSVELRRALVHAFDRATQALYYRLRDAFKSLAQDACEEHFGWAKERVETFPMVAGSTEDLLDYLEIIVDTGRTSLSYRDFRDFSRSAEAWPTAQDEINLLFERHRFGFRLERGEAHAVASPALDDAIVGPALLAVSQPGWEEVERMFREALVHQRGPASENDDALTAANAALEAALKAMGLRGGTLGELGKQLRASKYVPSQLAGVPEAMDALLQRSNALRSTHGDAHGKGPGAPEVPQTLVNLAVHLSGSFIVYLAEVSNDLD